ncbi:hypothetical protein ELI03_36095 [Rhizobium leguminosarum]|uniref:Uncharacterized protein n=1 Tax=Rhizobium leguminosarum TaxID=384 RepID=A0A4Q8XR37_RHILE|nr:hypothetical protein [Rhizobium leguminosarum]TAX63648.1 hypothetical protein ELI03_36095 [Rhizobium leguminosarum]
MNDIHEVALLSVRLEQILRRFGTVDREGRYLERGSYELPVALRGRLDGLIDDVEELQGLLSIGQAARRGEPLSPAVLSAARIITKEVCRALCQPDDPSKDTLQ